MSFCKLSIQQTLGGLIKKQDVAFKHSCCESALPARLRPAFNVAHIWSHLQACKSCVLTLLRLSSAWNSHTSRRSFTVTVAVRKKYDCFMSLCVCARVGVRLLSTSSFLSAAAAVAAAAVRLYPLCAACESITARWTSDLLARLSQRSSLHLLAK